MRAAARATATTPRHLLERRGRESQIVRDRRETDPPALVVLDELTTTLERALARVQELRESQRSAPAAA
jgi:hypothetical protein